MHRIASHSRRRPVSAAALTLLGWVVIATLVSAEPKDAAEPEPRKSARSDRQRATDRSPEKDATDSSEFKKAGVCARCHVVSVLEWGISGHVAAETNCQACHGSSKGHVANERNEVKPDRLPRSPVGVTQLCSKCHETGCPSTGEVQNCQSCHHMHALVNPAKPPAERNQRLQELLSRWDQFHEQMERGRNRVEQQDWKAARESFGAALKLLPGNHRARTQLEMCSRRLDPSLPGFRNVGKRFDTVTGLPREVHVAELAIPMLLVPPAEFDMGSDRLPESRPVHTVNVDAFYLGQHEITQSQWKAVMGQNPSRHQGQGFSESVNMPVENVSWGDCQEFLKRLNARVEGGGFRLPTEAEWEYAARGGMYEATEDLQNADRPQAQHMAELSQRAWYRANSSLQPNAKGAFQELSAYAPRPVGTRLPNAWGFHDLSGNVGEWCSSLYRPYLFDPSDGRESLEDPGMRIIRGGGFADSAAALDPTLRYAERPHRRFRFNGLRLARSVPGITDTKSTSQP